MTRRITVDVYEKDNTTHVGTLASDKGREWLDDLLGEGSGVVESKLDHADAALLTAGRVVRFSIEGTARWAGCDLKLNTVLADPTARASGRVVGLSCRGLRSVFDFAIVHPELGYGVLSPDTRYFGWMSRYYDHSGWDSAVELKAVNDPDPTKPWFGAPKGWNDKDAVWIGPTDGATPPVDPGKIYFWGDYTIPTDEGGDYQIELTADDAFKFYRDGDLEGQESRVALWGVARQLRFLADDGAHFFAAELTNFDRPNPSTNVTGFIASLAPMLGGGVAVGDPVSRTSSGTKMLAYPASEPGMTVGHIILVNVAENQDLGWCPSLTCDFDEVYDSDGVEWPVEVNVAFPVGSSMSEMLRHFEDAKQAEFAMDPEGLVLHAYVSKGSDLTGSVEVEYAVNVSRLGISSIDAGANTLASRTAEGRWMLFQDSAAATAWDTRFAGLSLGSAPSDTSAEQQASAYLADHAKPVDAMGDLQVEDERFVDGTVGTGDLVIAPTRTGTDTHRVHGLRFTEDAAGQPIVTPELVRQT